MGYSSGTAIVEPIHAGNAVKCNPTRGRRKGRGGYFSADPWERSLKTLAISTSIKRRMAS